MSIMMARTVFICGGGPLPLSSSSCSNQQPLVSFPKQPQILKSNNTSSTITTTTKTTTGRIGCGWSKRIGSSLRCFSALNPELKTTLDKVVTSHKVVLFMKGTKEFPQCGFSNTLVQILKSSNVPFETLNVLENEILRQALKEYSNWPTFPQLYIDGEFFGGCDITVEAYKNGELQELLEKAMCS